MEYSDVVNNWKNFAHAVDILGGDVQAIFVDEPATENEVAILEGKLGFELPPSVKEVLLNGDLLVATFAATLPASDVVQTPDGYVLLRLVRRDDELSGTAIAYTSAHRLEHLYPFATQLRRKAQ